MSCKRIEKLGCLCCHGAGCKNNVIEIAVTGIGVICPLTHRVNEPMHVLWKRLLDGESGVKSLNFQLTGHEQYCKIAGQITLDFEKYLTQYEAKYYDRFIQLGLIAARQALIDAGILEMISVSDGLTHEYNVTLTEDEKHRVGVSVGSGIGGLSFLTQGMHKMRASERISPFCIPGCLINLGAGAISIKYGFKGPCQSIVTACATGAHSIIDGCRMLREGLADYMVVGGSEAISELSFAGFAAMQALAKDYNDKPEEASRPYDSGRRGFVMGEGAAILVLERLDHALQRGAKIYATITGYGLTADAKHITNPDPDGARRSMKQALDMSGISADELVHMNTHATSTVIGDKSELIAIKELLGISATKPTISATKASTGHLLGASGALSAVFTVLALQEQVAPPTINFTNPDTEAYYKDVNVDESDCLMRISPLPQFFRGDYAMMNTLGFGGNNAAIVFKRYTCD